MALRMALLASTVVPSRLHRTLGPGRMIEENDTPGTSPTIEYAVVRPRAARSRSRSRRARPAPVDQLPHGDAREGLRARRDRETCAERVRDALGALCQPERLFEHDLAAFAHVDDARKRLALVLPPEPYRPKSDSPGSRWSGRRTVDTAAPPATLCVTPAARGVYGSGGGRRRQRARHTWRETVPMPARRSPAPVRPRSTIAGRASAGPRDAGAATRPRARRRARGRRPRLQPLSNLRGSCHHAHLQGLPGAAVPAPRRGRAR
jgi:hypothetical protein